MIKHSERKNWLILSHCFNMDGRAASQTITDKIPFLVKNGVTPIVISAPTGVKDTAFTHHQVFSPAPSGILFEMRNIIENKYQPNWLVKILKALITIVCFPFYLVEKIFINLDSHWSWFITAGIKAIWVARHNRFQLIYTTGGPSSTHLTGYILNKILGIPWIAEIHDPLVAEHGKKRYQRYAFHKWLEKEILKNACAVFYFTESACNNAKKRTCINNSAYVLRPGANPPEISDVQYEKREKIHFGHFGSLASNRNLASVMNAFAGIFKQSPALNNKIAFDVYGTTLDPASKRAMNDLSLGNVVQEYGRLEYDSVTEKSGRQKAFERMNLCDVLVLIHGHSDFSDEYIPSKLYEYLLTKRPILCLASPKSELASILESTGHRVVDPGNPGAIIAGLERLIHEWSTDRLNTGFNDCSFTVEATVTKMMKLVESGLKEK